MTTDTTKRYLFVLEDGEVHYSGTVSAEDLNPALVQGYYIVKIVDLQLDRHWDVDNQEWVSIPKANPTTSNLWQEVREPFNPAACWFLRIVKDHEIWALEPDHLYVIRPSQKTFEYKTPIKANGDGDIPNEIELVDVARRFIETLT